MMGEENAAQGNQPTIDRVAVGHFANIVFGYCEGFVAVRLLVEKGGNGKQELLWLSTGKGLSEELAHAAERAAANGLACYVIPGVVAAPGHAKAEHVIAMQVLCVDLDTGDIAAKLKHLMRYLGTPSLVVESGGVTPKGQAKLHVYFKLMESALDADVRRVCRLQYEIALKVGADPSFKSAHQPIRRPGQRPAPR
jgi:putative DNA primase/helicase